MWFPQLSKGRDVIEEFLGCTEYIDEPVYNEISSYYDKFYESAESEFGWKEILQMSNAFNAANIPNDDYDPYDYDDASVKKSDPLMKFPKSDLIGLAIPMAFLMGYASAAWTYLENKEASK